MSAPFRDLFVELPSAVLEVLQAIGEAAVVEASPRDASYMYKSQYAPQARVRTSWACAMASPVALASFVERYGWRAAEVRVMEASYSRELIATLDCGHRQRHPLCDFTLDVCTSAEEALDYVERCIAAAERRCYCVQRPA